VSRSRHGKHRQRRPGAHKGRNSPETLRWEREYLVPKRPAWMSEQIYVRLAQLRQEL
jgi:hypothetical protein